MKKITYVLILLFLLSPINVLSSSDLSLARPLNNTANKITDELRDVLDGLKNEERVTVYIWTSDIDYERIEHDVLMKTGLSRETFEIKQKDLTFLAEFLIGSKNKDDKMQAYLDQTKEERTMISKNIDRYTMEKRVTAKKEYHEIHKEFKEIHLKDADVLFQSQYAPMLICMVSKADVYRLEKLKQVTSISLFISHEDLDINDLSGDNDNIGGIVGLEVGLSSIDADYTRDTLGLRGNGVKIGQIEFSLPRVDIPDLENASIKRLSDNPTDSNESKNHASFIAALISGKNGIVPNAELVSTSMNDNAAYYRGIEQLLSEGVNIINMSAAINAPNGGALTGTYSNDCKWTDHIAHQHGVTFVKSSGNRTGSSASDNPMGYVTSPGMAYNVITVGAVDNRGTSIKGDDIFWEYSCHYHHSATASKPDVVAPGVGFLHPFLDISNRSGTSFSAALVTGVIAQMMEANPTYKMQSHSIKAMLMASCDRKVLGSDGQLDPREPMGKITEKQGAGVINARHAVNMAIARAEGTGGGYVGSVYVRHGEPPDRYRTHEQKIQLKRGVETNVVLTWLMRHNKSGEAPNVSRPELRVNDLDLEIFDRIGRLVGASYSTEKNEKNPSNNVRFTNFTPEYDGEYTVRVTRLGNPRNTLDDFFAVAYSSHPIYNATPDSNDETITFVTRFYRNVLEREPDADGLRFWMNGLKSGAETAQSIAYQFFFLQPEFDGKNIGDIEFIMICYNTFMDRSPDQDGLNHWVGTLNAGYSRRYVVDHMLMSPEFAGICAYYNINIGPVGGLEGFLSRMYSYVLDVRPDADGFAFWLDELQRGVKTGAELVDAFFDSEGFASRGVNNSQFVSIAYNTILNREPEADATTYWLGILNGGEPRRSVLYHMMEEPEYGALCNEYGIAPGKINIVVNWQVDDVVAVDLDIVEDVESICGEDAYDTAIDEPEPDETAHEEVEGSA